MTEVTTTVREPSAPPDVFGRPGHVPALDGYRGLGLIGMLCYHAGATWAQGAIFILSTFFTMSGFLITTLLLQERVGSGRVDLKQFWVRRFRRLLPASLAALAIVVVYGATFADQTQRASLRGDVLAALAYVANWRFVFSGTTYLNAVSTPSPVLHFWSLAIEEQFYLLFPVIVMVIVGVAIGRRRSVVSDSERVRRRMMAGLGVLLVVTFSLPFIFTMSQNRIYLGTDTRAPEILVGCLLAVFMWGRHRLGDQLAPGPLRTTLRFVGPVMLVIAVTMWVVVPKTAPWIYRGGFAAYSVVSALLVVACLDAVNLVSRVFSPAWLGWLGQRSYGIYLVHFPLFMVLSAGRTGLSFWPLFTVRVAVSVAVASVIYRYIEEPMRRGRPRLGQPLHVLAPIAIALIVTMLFATTIGARSGTVSVAAARADSLRIPKSAVRDDSPVVPEGSAVTIPTTTALPAAAPSPTAPPGGLVPTPMRKPARRLRMLVVGDSGALFLGVALSEWSQRNGVFGVADYGLMGCPLITDGTEFMNGHEAATDPKCATWRTFWSTAIAETKPDLIMVATNFHDIVDRRLSPGGPVQHVGQPEYDAVLAKAWGEAIDVLSKARVPIMWLDNPPVRSGQNQLDHSVELSDNDPARMRRANEILAGVAATHPGVTVVPYSQFFLTWPGGVFDPKLREDGLHVDFDGKAIVTRWLAPELLAAYWRATGR